MLYKNIPNADELKELVRDLGHPFQIATSADKVLRWADTDSYPNIVYTWHSCEFLYDEAPFQLDTTPFQNIKPEVYEVGDTVEVLEVAREAGNYEYWSEKVEQMIGKQFCVENVCDDCDGVSYELGGYHFPSYAVRKVVDFAETEPEPEPKPDEIIELNGKKYKLIEE
jgi:hypothetical protein